MAEYFVGTFGECTSLVARMNTLMGYPNPETKTYRYAIPKEHAASSGTYLVIMKQVHAPKFSRRINMAEMLDKLTPVEKGQIKTREALEAEGAFTKDVV